MPQLPNEKEGKNHVVTSTLYIKTPPVAMPPPYKDVRAHFQTLCPFIHPTNSGPETLSKFTTWP